jgi:sugar O-acyltransferase (sialic acid O-acetyltransferase NeuD family)
MRAIAILGAGGHAREQLDLIAALNEVKPRYEVLGFVVDEAFAKPGEQVRGLPVLGATDWLADNVSKVELVCAIGEPAARRRVVLRAEGLGARFCSLVHPSVVMSGSVELGAGSIVSAGSVLSSDIRIGPHVHVNIGSSISHDCRLDEYATLAPGAHLAGVVRVGAGCQLGLGTVVSDRCSLGEWAITGAGAVVVDDVPSNTTAVGVPARVIETRLPGWHLETGD